MKPTLVKCVRSDAKEFTIGLSDWKITKLEGIDAPNFSLFTDKNAVGDGAMLSGKRVDDRDVYVEAKSRFPQQNEAIRTRALEFFNPKYTYRVHVTYLGTTRWIEGELAGFSIPAENVYRNMTMKVRFYCPDPYFRSEDNFGKDIASSQKMFGFPYIQTAKIKTVASAFNFAKLVKITNDGDVETYCMARILFSGETTNPKIVKDDYFVRVCESFTSGDVLEIDFANATIRKNGTNIIQKIDRGSTFTSMQLDVGPSNIGFAADTGDANMSVTIYYNKLYLGV